jgi:hypothetical protein
MYYNFLILYVSNLAQRKRVGLITQRSLDRHQELLHFFSFLDHGGTDCPGCKDCCSNHLFKQLVFCRDCREAERFGTLKSTSPVGYRTDYCFGESFYL